MSVPMEEKTEKSKGKRVTKNSTIPRGDNTDLEEAVRKSKKEQRRIAKRKAKEDKEFERALELSRLDAEREKSASLMLELQSASSSSPPKLDVLGATSISGAKVRVCALTEEKALNSDDSSNRLMLQSPPDNSPFESKNSKSPENADPVGGDELDVSSEHESVSNVDTSPARSMNSTDNGETLPSPSEKRKTVVKKEAMDDDRYSCEHLLASTSELESVHTTTERESSSDASESSHSCVTQNVFEAINNTADTWEGEDDVIQAMKSLALTKPTVVVNTKVFAGVVFKARPPVCEVKELLQAQEKSFEVAKSDLNKRLAQIRASETLKMQEPRR